MLLSFDVFADINLSSARNPKYNANINPKYNANINTRYNLSIYGLYIFSNNDDVTGFTVFADGIGVVYDKSSTLNGYLIVSSAVSGKVESFKKIGDPIVSSPIINNGKLFILTENSRIVGLN